MDRIRSLKPFKRISLILREKINLRNFDWILLAEAGTGLFFVVKILYWLVGTHENTYWEILYYLAMYCMLMGLFVLAWSYMIRKEDKLFFGFAGIFFAGMFLLHIACLIDTSLYDRFVQGTGYYGVSILILAIGIPYIFIKMRKYGRRYI